MSWVVVPCSGAKALGERLSARERYTGSLHRLAMQAGLALTAPERVRILSARYGLLRLDDPTAPYDVELGKLSRDDHRALCSKVHCEACSMYWEDGKQPGYVMAPVVALVPRAYLDVLRRSPLLDRALVAPLADCDGIGRMRQRLAAIRDTGALR